MSSEASGKRIRRIKPQSAFDSFGPCLTGLLCFMLSEVSVRIHARNGDSRLNVEFRPGENSPGASTGYTRKGP